MQRHVIESGLLAGCLLLAACAPAPASPVGDRLAGELTVFAAASLTGAFAELGVQFQTAHPEATITFNFGASNQLAQQIVEGAPADVLASANQTQMQVAIDGGRILSGTQQTFVRNRLVVIYPEDNPAPLATLHDLARPGVKLVLAAAEVPAGKYALDFIDKAAQDPAFGASFKDNVLANVVSYEENVRAVYTKVALGEADAGIVYTSDVAGDGAEAIGQIAIPDSLNTIAAYPIAVLADSPNPALAQAFVDLVLSEAGQVVLARYGFVTVK